MNEGQAGGSVLQGKTASVVKDKAILKKSSHNLQLKCTKPYTIQEAARSYTYLIKQHGRRSRQ